jgi:hypothetical protein
MTGPGIRFIDIWTLRAVSGQFETARHAFGGHARGEVD